MHDLTRYGLHKSVSITGNLVELLEEYGAPIVFLIDENHTSSDCINENVANATELVTKCNVDLIGVESHSGGYTWNCIFGRYDKDLDPNERLQQDLFGGSNPNIDPGDSPESVGACTQFADSLRNIKTKVVGVESLGLHRQLESDTAPGGSGYGEPISDNSWNLKRSEHFLRTLFQLRGHHGLSGNLILNVGGQHNTHVAEWIQDGSIENKAGSKASYIRVTASSYSAL